MKKIVIVQNSIKTTYNFRRHYIMKALKFNKVAVIAPNDDEFSKQSLENLGVQVYTLPMMSSLFSKVASFFLLNIYIFRERLNGSVFICHFLTTFVLSFFTLAPFNNKLIIYTEGLGSFFSNKVIPRSILRFFLVSERYTRLFCNLSERKALGRDSDIVTGGIGIELPEFPLKVEVKTNDEYQLLYVGRLLKDKGVVDAICVFRTLKDKGYSVKLNLVGDIYKNNPSSLSDKDVQSLKSEFGTSINFVGYTEDVLTWYNNSHVLLLPSIREGFPVCVMEASSVGVPTVGYDVDGVNSAVVPHKNGLLAEQKNIEHLTKLTEKLLSTDVLNKYRLSCSQHANNHFDIEPKSEQILDIVNDLYSKKNPTC
ncbi:glycosyltransferase [Vibrio breoganii]